MRVLPKFGERVCKDVIAKRGVIKMKLSELSDQQKNELVHEKVLGKSLLEECDGGIGELPTSSDGWFCGKCGYSDDWSEVRKEHKQQPPKYCRSLERAWEIIQSVSQRKKEQYKVDFIVALSRVTDRRIPLYDGLPTIGLSIELATFAELRPQDIVDAVLLAYELAEEG